MRIAVVGSGGQLGSAMAQACGLRHQVTRFDRASLDITDPDSVAQVLGRAQPDAIVNCAGHNAVDAAETHPVEAMQANAFAVRSLARAARELGAALVQFSSDFVFDGTASAPMTEDVVPNPRSAYAMSKLLGEWFAAEVPQAYVLRVESLFGAGPGGADKGSLAAIVRGLREGRVVRVFRDRVVSPTFVHDASMATIALLERRSEPGLYHCVNSGAATWLDVAREAARVLSVEPVLEIVSVADVTLPAARPRYCAMSNGKLALATGFSMPTWQDALARYLLDRRYPPDCT